MSRAPRSNLLALTVLAELHHGPSHPYDIARRIRETHKDEFIKLNMGSLYSVVDALAEAELIVATDTVQEGRRPQRTVYDLTHAGRVELHDWLAELVSEPRKEYSAVEAALTLLGALDPDEAMVLLDQRIDNLTIELRHHQEIYRRVLAEGVPELFLVELAFRIAMLESQHDFMVAFLDRLHDGSIGGLDMWRGQVPCSAPYASDQGGQAPTAAQSSGKQVTT
jgi:DNA-binding PadR family transcriptional regulator